MHPRDVSKIREWIENNFTDAAKPADEYYSELINVWCEVRFLADVILRAYAGNEIIDKTIGR